MRLSTATQIVSLALASSLTHGFNVAGRAASTRTPTSLEARRSMLPVLRRSGMFFPDIDRMFEEMDELMENSFSAMRFPRPSLSALGGDIPEELMIRRPLGFKVVQDEKEYKLSVHIPNVEAEDIDLQLDNDGRVLRLKGAVTREDGGMKVQSRFEKALELGPDVDTLKLVAEMSGDTLTVVAPKIEGKAASDKAESKRVEIKSEEPKHDDHKAALQAGVEPADGNERAPTRLAVEDLKNKKDESKPPVDAEKNWPVRDFPY